MSTPIRFLSTVLHLGVAFLLLTSIPGFSQQKTGESGNQRLREGVKELKEGRKLDGERIKRLEDIVDKLVKEKAAAQPQAPEKPPGKEKGQEALEREVEEFLKQSGTGKKEAAPAPKHRQQSAEPASRALTAI